MRKFKTFALTLKNSLTNQHYANDILRAPLSFSFKFYTAMVAAITVLVALIWSIAIAIFPLKSTVEEFTTQIFPQDFEFRYQNGHWQINQPLPYSLGENFFQEQEIDTSETTTALSDSSILDTPSSLVLFTTSEQIPDVESFRASGALIAFTDNYVYAYANANLISVRAFELQALPDDSFSLSHATIQGYIDGFFNNFWIKSKLYAVAIFLIIALALFLFMWPIILIGLIIYTFFAWLLSKIIFGTKKSFTFSQVFQIGLHTIWMLELLNWLILSYFNLPFLWLIKFAIYGSWTLIQLNNYQPPTPPSPPRSLPPTKATKKNSPAKKSHGTKKTVSTK